MRINNASVTTVLVRNGHYVLDAYNVRVPETTGGIGLNTG
jgi:hypothetical protein